MLSEAGILIFFLIFVIGTLIGFYLVYKYYHHKVNSNRIYKCIEKIINTCRPKNRDIDVVDDAIRRIGGLNSNSKDYFSEENREKLISNYVQKGTPYYSRISALFKNAFDREDEQMLRCLEDNITTYNNEASCGNIKRKEMHDLEIINYLIAAVLFGILLTVLIFGIYMTVCFVIV